MGPRRVSRSLTQSSGRRWRSASRRTRLRPPVGAGSWTPSTPPWSTRPPPSPASPESGPSASCGSTGSAHTLRAEADATVHPDLTVTEAHDIAHDAETHLLDQVRRLTAATIHTSPAGTHPARRP
jgi:hypothetical protein